MDIRTNQIALYIQESSQVAEARRKAVSLAEDLGFAEIGLGKIAIVATELGKNLVKHTKGGEMLIRSLLVDQKSGLEIMTLDKGPGIANLTLALTDTYSTAGSPGTGLGSIKRQSDVFDIHSTLNKGTAVMARLWSKAEPKRKKNEPALEIGVVCLPKPGEKEYGDNWAVAAESGRCLILVSDGLGHGPLAAEVSSEVVRIFNLNKHLPPARLMEVLHAGLRGTRGAVIALAEVDLSHRVIRYCGVGNISGLIFSSKVAKGMVSYNGTVGSEIAKIREFTYPWPKEALLLLYSDGLISHFHLDDYPGLWDKHPALIAGILYRDYTRGRDDVTVVAVKEFPWK